MLCYNYAHAKNRKAPNSRAQRPGDSFLRAFLIGGQMSLQDLNTWDLMALLIRAEADNQPLAGKIGVAYTVVERYKFRPLRYGQTPRAVMLKPMQYSCFNEDRYWLPFYDPTSLRFINARELALGVVFNDLDNPAPGATHYYNPAIVTPFWADPKYSQFIAQIGDHIFMREIV